MSFFPLLKSGGQAAEDLMEALLNKMEDLAHGLRLPWMTRAGGTGKSCQSAACVDHQYHVRSSSSQHYF